MAWELEASERVLRPRPLRAAVAPLRERKFLFRRYEAFVERLADSSRFRVVPLRDLATAPTERVVVALRHDVDLRLDAALELARLERRYGLPATYFVLHTAPYYGITEPGRAEHDPALLPRLRTLQDGLGHEIGWHHDLVTLQCVYGVEPVRYLADELSWLREAGVDVRGCAAHGSYWCHALGFSNNYFFADFPEVVRGFPNRNAVEVNGRRCEIATATLADFGLEYEANHLPTDEFFSDARFDAGGHRWHPDRLDLDSLRPGQKVILLVHPCHWDSSFAGKLSRTVARGAGRALELAADPRVPRRVRARRSVPRR